MIKFYLTVLFGLLVLGTSHAQSGGTVGSDIYGGIELAAFSDREMCLSVCNGKKLNKAGSAMIAYAVAEFFWAEKEECYPITNSSPIFDCQGLNSRFVGPYITREMKHLLVDGKRYCTPLITPNMSELASINTRATNPLTGKRVSQTFEVYVRELKRLAAIQNCSN